MKLQNLIFVYKENLQYAKKLQKHYNDKNAKPRSYVLGDKT